MAAKERRSDDDWASTSAEDDSSDGFGGSSKLGGSERKRKRLTERDSSALRLNVGGEGLPCSEFDADAREEGPRARDEI